MLKISEIFIQGIENMNYFNSLNNVYKKKSFYIKYLFWILALIVCSKRHDSKSKDGYFIYNDLQNKIYYDTSDNYKTFHGDSIKKISDISKKNTIVSYLTFKEKIITLFKSIASFSRVKISKKYLAYWIDFNFIYKFLKKNSFSNMNVAGHFDRYATWMSLLCEAEGINYRVKQHGAICKLDMPNRIYCNELTSFNNCEIELFKSYIIKNKDCVYKEVPFKSKLTFKEIEKQEGIVYIGIASQDAVTEHTIELIEKINKNVKFKVNILLYPHYRESISQFEGIRKFENVEIYTDFKHKNVDMLITFFSTIVYDFLIYNPKINVVCLPPKDIEMGFFQLSNVEVRYSDEDLIEYINLYIESMMRSHNER